MKPLNVAVLTRPGSLPGDRNAGWWAYPTSEFIAHFRQVPKGETLSRAGFTDCDLILWEDGKTLIHWEGAGPPVCYLVCDSTLSPAHYQHRCEMARQADLILVDWDRLERFEELGKPVRRWSYCVDERRFRDYGLERRVDLAFIGNIAGDAEREQLDVWLCEFCAARGYVYDAGSRAGLAYAQAFAAAKIVVNLNRTPATRNHRLFDAMAAGCCVLTSPVPAVSDEERQAGLHYREWASVGDLGWQIDYLLTTGEWERVARAGYELVQRAHTWAVRARQLRALLGQVFPALGAKPCLSS